MALLAAGQVLASAVLDPLLDRAVRAAADEFKLIRGVHKEIQKLAQTLKIIKCVLVDAEERQVKETTVGDWLRQLKQLFLDADDLLDEYTTNATLQASMAAERKTKVRTVLFRCCTCIGRPMTDRATAHQIVEINGRLDYLVQQKKQFEFKISSEGSSRFEHGRRAHTSSILADVTSVIGRDREQERIIRLLLSPINELESSSSNNINFCLLPIIGMGGLGKTTLARLVYNDKKVMNHFNIRIWICASNEFDYVRFTKEMIDAASASQGHKEEYQITNWDLIQRKLREKVQEKTFLLVLDDVWEGSWTQWENLFKPLMSANKESKILVTSRNIDAVNNIGQRRMHPVILRSLSDDDLWLFFKRCAFDGYNLEEYIYLQGIGRQIANRLKGLPLAAKTIGHLLNTKLDFNHWRNIAKNEMWKMQQQNEDDILPTLGLSYQYLPGYLKQCFSYCSLFPKDYLFCKRSLERLWNAECFNRLERNIEMDDVSSEDFDDLLRRSFFEPAPYRRDWYVMHDLMHDLAEYVSKDDCFRLEDNKNDDCFRLKDNKKSIINFDTVRHMSLNVKKFNLAELNKFCRLEKLRTFLFLRGCEFNDPILALDELFLKLKRLRVLKLSQCGIKELPSSIGHLKHLRYIDLSYNSALEQLPESLCDLYNLQVLELVVCYRLRALPTRTSELINLRYLVADSGLVSKIDGLSKLTGLQEIQVRGGKVMELGGMSMLRKIRIDFLQEVRTEEEVIQARLHSKEHLQELRLSWSIGRHATSIDQRAEEDIFQALRPADSIEFLEIWGYGGAKSPDWMEDQSVRTYLCLKTVILAFCRHWEVLPSLGQLQILRVLKIRFMDNVRRLDLGLFPLLDELHIEHLPEWEEWGGPSRDGDHPLQQNQNPSSPHLFFPRLRDLLIQSCPRLMELPPLPPTLTKLSLSAVGLTCLPGLSECHGGTGDVSHLSSASAALSNLIIKECPKLTSVAGLLVLHLTALEQLEIFDCKELLDLPEKGFGHLVSLKTLTIKRCPQLTCPPLTWDEEDEDAPSQHLPSSLEILHIDSCGDAMGGWWWAGLQRLTSLASLSLSGCSTTAAALFVRLARHRHHHLAETLTHLYIWDCGYDYQQQSMPSTSISLPPPPAPPNPPEHATAGVFQSLKSLQEFSIYDSHNLLREWGGGGLPSSLQQLNVDGDDGLDDECLSTCLQRLTSLQHLSISRCPAITSLPAGAVEDHHHRALLLHSQVMMMTALQNLYIKNCQELASLGHFPALPSLSLKILGIRNCPKLNPLQISSTSSSIEELNISDSSPQQMRGWLLNSNLVFQKLRIGFCSQLTSFDEEGGGKELEEALLHQAPSLRLLTIEFCGNLRSLPAELSSLSSLETLQVSYCLQIQSLPGLPSSLRTLSIKGCPALKERCRDQGGPEWPKISRIPEVHID